MLPVLLAALVLGSTAAGAGGKTIAVAPELPNGTTVDGSGTGWDFWRLTIVPGDALAIDYEPIGLPANQQMQICLLDPTVTDFTINDAECVRPANRNSVISDRKQRATWSFSQPGRYTLGLHARYSGPNGKLCHSLAGINTLCDPALAYSLTAYVVHLTRVTLDRLPRLVKAGSSLKLSGVVRGGSQGAVAVQMQKSGRWVGVFVTPIDARGHFRNRLKVPKRAGNYQYRVVYPGDATHRSSTARFGLIAG